MKTWHIAIGLALLVLLFLSVREGFAATATIKNPNTWDATELARIKAMVPSASTISDADIRRVVGGFWSVWDGATTRITLAQVNTYLDTAQSLGSNRNTFRDLIQAYYIDQGQSVFTDASGYTAMATATPSAMPSAQDTTTPSTTIERPTTATNRLRQDIATTMGIPLTDSTSIDAVVTQVQAFYDKVYLPDKKTPSYTQIMGFADGVDTQTLPASIKNNFKVHIVSILQSYFSTQTGVSETSSSSAMKAGPVSNDVSGDVASGWAGTGKNVQGPSSGGRGNVNTTGGLGQPRNYPVLYGGLQDYKSALPTSSSLGTDPGSKFLPYSRVPGDQDLYPDPYRLGKYFSSSSYSEKEASDPAPFLADFSKFFT